MPAVARYGTGGKTIWLNGIEECHMLRVEAALLMPHIDIVMYCGFEI